MYQSWDSERRNLKLKMVKKKQLDSLKNLK